MAEPNGGAMKGGHVSQFWKSGSVRGYNGDGIAITLLYDMPNGSVSPDFVDLRFADNSVRKDGPVARIRRFSPENTQWTDIPLPDPEGTIGEGVNEDFSIQGQFRFEARSPGRLLRVRFHWGAGQVHSEEGYVLMLKQ